MLRRVAVLAAGLAMMASVGLAGVGTASAASPGLKIKQDAVWTNEVKAVHGCEQDTFNTATHTFTADGFADSGTWSGGTTTITMIWTTGANNGLIFTGHFVRTTTAAEYKGYLSDANLKSKLVKGAVAGC